MYTWLSNKLNEKATLLSEKTGMCGFSKALRAIRKIWVDKYERVDSSTSRFAHVGPTFLVYPVR